MPLQLLLLIVGIVILALVGIMVIVAKFYRKVDQGKALIINKMKIDPEVTFTGGVVYPIIHRAEVMDISVKTIELERRGKEGLICKDNIRADIKVTFFVKVNKTVEDVLKVAQAIGCARASDQRTLEELFTAKFSEALKTVGKRLEFEQLYTQRDVFKDQIIEVIGKDLNGYVLEDAAIDFLEQTPIDMLDRENILDVQGIRKITELTATQNIQTNELKQKERMEIGSQNLKADEAIYRFDHARADAEAKKAKEIAMAQAREQNEALRVQADEEKRTALTRQKADEEVQIGEQNKRRAVEVSEKAREREVEVKRIEKEKALEVERKNIADVIRTRIAVEKSVAEEEERIKDLRADAEAQRSKRVVIVGAEAEAQESLVKSIKAAEAGAEVAKFDASKRLTLAEAALEAADKEARAKVRMAEGVQAEEAAIGLAKVRVAEAEAVAIEKQGKAKAVVTFEQLSAEAQGTEATGMAAVKVREAQADALRKEGVAQADVVRGTKLAEAAGDEEKGLAGARVAEAEAGAIQKRGLAEASAVRERLSAEASGLAAKADAMKALDGSGREHEEFRIKLEQQKEIAFRTLDARMNIATAQAEVLARAFDQARINIVGGDGQFFDRFIKAVSLGQSVDGFIDNSEVARNALSGYVEGKREVADDLRDILGGVTSGDLKNLSIAGILARLASRTSGDARGKIEALATHAKNLGIDDVTPS